MPLISLITNDKWALVLLPAPTTPDLWKSLARGQFFPVSGVRITKYPEGRLGHQTAVGLSPGVDLSGEALIRTWLQLSCSNLSFVFFPLARPIHSGPVSDCFAAVQSLSRRSAFSWRHRCLTNTKSHQTLSRTMTNL
jgi:hypothetical protein